MICLKETISGEKSYDTQFMLLSRKMSLFISALIGYTNFQFLEASWWFNHVLRPSNEVTGAFQERILG